MNERMLLLESFSRIQERVHAVVDGLDRHQLGWAPARGANPIAWLVWHLTRVQDDHVAEVADLEQAWTSAGWHSRFGLDLAPTETGYGHDDAKVAKVHIEHGSLLVGYYDDVHARSLRFLDGVDGDALERIVDTRFDPHVTLGVRLVSVVEDSIEHIGQAAYLRGLLERQR